MWDEAITSSIEIDRIIDYTQWNAKNYKQTINSSQLEKLLLL